MARKQFQRLRGVRNTSRPRPTLTSGLIGAVLVAVCAIWLGWLFQLQAGGAHLPTLPDIIFAPTASSNAQIAPLAAEGITLGHTTQTPTMSQQQAVLIANQLEPDAAASSKGTSAQYVLLNYPNQSTPAIHANFNSVPTWMVVFEKIPLKSAGTAVEPGSSSRSSYDLYVFLDANSGKELLAVQD